MTNPKLTIFTYALAALIVVAILWHAFAPTPRPPSSVAPVVAPPDSSQPQSASSSSSPGTPAVTPSQPTPGGPAQTASFDQAAHADARRQLRQNADATYLNDGVAQDDSALHHWVNRGARPVRVFLRPDTAAGFPPGAVDAVRGAFDRWSSAGIPVAFDLGADSVSAEVHIVWTTEQQGDAGGRTELEWKMDGAFSSAVVTLDFVDASGQPRTADQLRIMALHQIGHLIGLEHSPVPTDVMSPNTSAHDLSARDIQSAGLLYQLPTGSVR
ncbi:MAG TPA: matrixin family metalloprotease [Gemmatimonadales bacterium]|nr:matrixin family metalloprotease [Gemmatimonadales bacterium]